MLLLYYASQYASHSQERCAMLCLMSCRFVSLVGDCIIYTDIKGNKLKKEHIMAYFLAKTDPKTYSIDDLERDKTTVWDGVRSAAALLAIRAMRHGDEVLIYHSKAEAAIVGLARIASEPRPDPNDSKSWVA